jgi:hypothetical protein
MDYALGSHTKEIDHFGVGRHPPALTEKDRDHFLYSSGCSPLFFHDGSIIEPPFYCQEKFYYNNCIASVVIIMVSTSTK